MPDPLGTELPTSYYGAVAQPTGTPADERTDPGRPRERRYPMSLALKLAIVASVLVCGVLGFVIAYAISAVASANDACLDLPKNAMEVCRKAHDPGATAVLWGVAGATIGVAGSAVVAVLLGRSYGEWRMLRSGGPSRETDLAESDETRPPKTC